MSPPRIEPLEGSRGGELPRLGLVQHNPEDTPSLLGHSASSRWYMVDTSVLTDKPCIKLDIAVVVKSKGYAR